MLKKLNDLVFGFSEFKKVKFEIRFNLISKILSSINISSLEEFELLEKIIYKIKDLLRLKSSNLNKAIRDPSNKLRKKDVMKILDELNNLKYNFLSSKCVSNNYNVNLEEENLNLKKDGKISKIKKEKKIVNLNKKKFRISKILFYETDFYQCFLENYKFPYILIKLKDNNFDFNLVDLKLLSSTFYSLFHMDGSNIIIENNIALIIPRFNDDNLFNLLVNSSINIEEVFNQLKVKIDLKLNNGYLNIEDEKKLSKKKFSPILTDKDLEKDEKVEEITSFTDYLKTKKKQDNIKILKNKSDSLDSLIKKQIETKDEIITKDRDPEKNIRIERLNEDEKNIVVEKKVKEKKNEIEFEFNERKENCNNDDEENKYLVYLDDILKVFINVNSKVFGELDILHVTGNSFDKISESDLTYIFIFSKVFSSVLFEVLKPEGTNMIWNFNENILRIIPRFQNDGLDNLKIPTKQESPEFLEQIKLKLIKKLSEHLGENNNSNNNLEQNKIKKDGIVENLNQNISNDDENSNNKGSDDLLKEKAYYILESLKRIP